MFYLNIFKVFMFNFYLHLYIVSSKIDMTKITLYVRNFILGGLYVSDLAVPVLVAV